jgi:hypothetical protein
MADDVTLPGTGAVVAADDIGGTLHQRVKVVVGADGVSDGDVSLSNPLPIQGVGELVEQLSAIRMLLQSLSRSVGMAMPDAAGQLRVNIAGQGVSINGQTVNVTTLTNQTQIGGLPATEQIPSLMRMGSDALRRNIVVT